MKAAFAGATLALCGCATAAEPAAAPAIVAVGDVHGDYDAYSSILRDAGLIDAKGKWTGGKTILVQTGDVPDRGPDTRKIVEHLMKLEKDAKKKGGKVVALIGNHEAMNVIGDLRYVTPEEFAAFKTTRSKRLRDAYYDAHKDELAAFYREKNPLLDEAAIRAAFEKDVPLGYLEHRAAWSPKGKFGAWVSRHDAVAIVGDTLFVHGGISDAYVAVPAEEINRQVREALKAGASGGILEDENGPLWFRGNADGAAEGGGTVASALANFGVKRLVVGHTPQLSGVKSQYGGRVIVVDTGASAFYGGTRSYLRIDANGVVAVDNGVSRTLEGVE
jgi:hypothetical protein